MADNDPYTYDDESGIMELRLVGDEFVPQQAIGTLPEAYYVDPAIDDATIEKYGMSEPYLPASFSRPDGVTPLGRIVRDALMRDQGKFPLATLGGDPRVFASGPNVATTRKGYYAAGSYYPPGFFKDNPESVHRQLMAESDSPEVLNRFTPFGKIYVAGTEEGKIMEEITPSEMEITAIHEARHRAFNIIRQLRPGFEKSLTPIFVQGTKGPKYLDEEGYVRLFDIGSGRDEEAEKYIRREFGVSGYELINHPAVRANMLRYQKVGQDLAKEYGGDFDYEFAPSQVNIPNQEELKKTAEKDADSKYYFDPKFGKIRRRNVVVIK